MAFVEEVPCTEASPGQHEVLALHQRLGEIHRILGDADARQDVSVTHEVLGQGRLVAHRQAVAADPALLDVRRADHQHVADPLARGKPLPGVRRDLGGMRAAVHVDRPGLIVGADVVLDRDELLRIGVPILPDAKIQRAAVDIRRDVHTTLLFRQRDAGRIPAVGELSRRRVDRQTEIIAEVGARNTLRKVFLVPGTPGPREIGLREGRRAEDGQPQQTPDDSYRHAVHDSPVIAKYP
jgi:hypothetical protein